MEKNEIMKKHKGRVSQVPNDRPLIRKGEIIIISRNYGRIEETRIKTFILTLKRLIPGSKIMPRIYGNVAVTKKPSEVRMGKGKGSINEYVARVRPNTIMFEIKNVPLGLGMTSLKSVSTKLGIQTKIVKVTN